MKVYNLSYNNKELFEEVHAITGRPYGFFKSLKYGGTGSPSLRIYDAPDEVMTIIHQNVDKKYTNIEILSHGIIIRFKSRLENYGVPLAISDIQQIDINPEKIDDTYLHMLELRLSSGELFRFSIEKNELSGIVKFFSKDIFKGKTRF
jgi:hypothetical protein